MSRVTSIFSQILQLYPRLEFEAAVKYHKAERHSRGFSCWGQFIAMLFCQLGRAHSLREITQGLAASEGKLRHLGLQETPKRSTLAYANANRSWELYQTIFEILYRRCSATASARQQKFSFTHKLLSIDSTVITVCTSLFGWANYKQRKGALKLHLLLDHDGYVPKFAVITDGKESDISVALEMEFEPGTMLVFDRGYIRYGWWAGLSKKGVWFVSRLRENAKYEVIDSRLLPPDPDPKEKRTRVRADRRIVFPEQKQQKDRPEFRLVEIVTEEGEVLEFITNAHHLEALTVAGVYKDRWQIETFFRSLKQLLKIKTFVGTNENAVRIQIWTALIAMLILRYLKLRASFNWSLSNLLALLRQQLFVHRDLWGWLDKPFEPPPEVADAQPLLWPEMAGN
ncbi:MAG TPA: IS4 family transposase [Candidatus Binatia bacterium]